MEEELERECYETGRMRDVSAYLHSELYLYIANLSSAIDETAATFETASPGGFAKTADPGAMTRYHSLWQRVVDAGTIVVESSRKKETGENRIMIGFPLRFVNHFLSNISRIMRRSGVPIGRKYSHVFGGCHPVVISSFYSTVEFPKDLVEQLVDISLYPDNKIARLVEADAVTAREANFINAAIEFIHQFIRFKDANLALLRERLVGAEDLREIIKGVQRRADKDNYPFEMIIEAFAERPDVIKALCRVFTSRFAPSQGGRRAIPPPRLLRTRRSSVPCRWGRRIPDIPMGLAFVDSILRTNFFLPVKSALAFRLKREFLEGSDYEAVPYGVFMIKGRNFFGFHTRFKDIARGGIRIVRASTVDDSQMNADHAFEECYNLAFTQNKKNKDIPEGGSKGIIILAPGASPADSTRAFMRYVDALLDLLLPSSRSYIAALLIIADQTNAVIILMMIISGWGMPD